MTRFAIPGGYAIWNRSHTINYYTGTGREYDVSSLYPSDGRKPTQLEVLDVIQRHLLERVMETVSARLHGDPRAAIWMRGFDRWLDEQRDTCPHLSMDDCGKPCHHLECPDCGLLISTPDVYPVDVTELSLCADCIYWDAYGRLADDADPDAQPMTRLDGWLISPNETDHICEGHFGYGCDGCDTRLGGTRYCYIGSEA